MQGLLLLIAFQMLGELLQELFLASIPGPLIGMVLLFLSLAVKPHLKTLIEPITKALFKHLMLIYIAFGVGLMQFEALISNNGLAILFVVVVSALISIVLIGLIGQRMSRHASN